MVWSYMDSIRGYKFNVFIKWFQKLVAIINNTYISPIYYMLMDASQQIYP